MEKDKAGRSPTTRTTTNSPRPSPIPLSPMGSNQALPNHRASGPLLAASSKPGPWDDLYQDPWFCWLIVLIYLLSLVVAADVLYHFPYQGGTYDLKADIGGYLTRYFSWLGVNLAILLVFSLVAVSLCSTNSALELRWKWWDMASEHSVQSKDRKERTLLFFAVILLAASSAARGYTLDI